MPKVHYVEKAMKDYPDDGVFAGESYYWWRCRPNPGKPGVTKRSRLYPRRSELTQSPFLATAYAMVENLPTAFLMTTHEELEEVAKDLEALARELADLGDGERAKLDSLPPQLWDAGPSRTIRQRAEWCFEMAENVAAAATHVQDELGGADIEDAKAAVQSIIDELDWSGLE
jgi:hypothetical protein